MLEVKQHGDKWQLRVDETWEFDNTKGLKKVFEELLKAKEEYGQMENFTKRGFQFK